MKTTRKQRISICQLFGDLLGNGFSLQQVLAFFKDADVIKHEVVAVFEQHLSQGDALATSFSELNYSSDQILQVELAEVHGDLANTLTGIARQMQLVQKQRENFIKAVSYPLVLFVFLIVILSGMRFFLLPQLKASGMLKEENLAVFLIEYVPILLAFFLIVLLLVSVYWRWRGRRYSYLERYMQLAKVPLIGKIHRDYYSAYFAMEWGKLFQQGLELQQIMACLLATEKTSLMKELAEDLQKSLAQGRALTTQLQTYSFLTQEFGQIVRQGEARGNLGRELLAYSEFTWQRFFNYLEFFCSWLQPLVFLFVAVLIISIYVAMLLPLSGNLEGLW